MYAVTWVETFSGAPLNLVSGICDLEVQTYGGLTRLFSVTRAGGGLLSLQVGPATLSVLETRTTGVTTVLPAPAELDLATLGGVPVLFVSGANVSRQGGYRINADGSFGNALAYSGTPAGVVAATEIVTMGADSYLYQSRAGTETIEVLKYQPGPKNFLAIATYVAGPSGAGNGLGDLTAVTIGAKTFLLASHKASETLRAFEIATDGTLAETSTLGASDGLGLTDPEAVRLLHVAGKTYAVVAGSSSSSLTLVEITADGLLRPADHVIDTMTTRFQAVQAVATVTVGDRGFILAGGSDAGLQVFQVLPGGRIVPVGQVLDAAGMALDNITALTARVEAGVIEIFVGTEGTGIVRLRLDPGPLAPTLSAPAAGGTLTGGAGGDLLIGGAGNDSLVGADGIDILVDGAGRDTLSGGAGADLFVLVPDGEEDTITDFQVGIDRLDLTQWTGALSAGAVQVETTATGAILTLGNERLVIQSGNGQPIQPSAFAQGGIAGPLFPLWHALPDGGMPARILAGTAQADRMIGGIGNDTFLGSAGADHMLGWDGIDCADYSAGTDAVSADLVTGGSAGAALGDAYSSIENLRGGQGNDSLWGDSGANHLWGSAGHDVLSGRGGADTLEGGDGDDTLDGGAGADRLDGGAGRDRARYGEATVGVRVDLQFAATNTGDAAGDVLIGIEDLEGSAFNDILAGDGTANALFGGDGHDILAGRGGADSLYGGDGNDTLVGGAGADLLDGGAGRDMVSHWDAGAAVRVDLQFQATNTGDAQGDVLIGIEDIAGTAFADTLAGDGGGNWLQGLGGHDILAGRGGADTLDGGEGNDTLVGGAGPDRLDGGAGRDTASYWDALSAVRVDMQYQSTNTGDAAGDTLISIEDITGSAFADILAGDGAANILQGLAGHDVLAGRAGNDTLVGGDGNDTLVGGAGADRLDGGTGRDTASYWDAFSAVVADLLFPAAGTGDALGDSFISIEDLTGSAFGDRLSGDDFANTLSGLAGNDTLVGRGGDDLLIGGAGEDVFVFHEGRDVIADFEDDVDRIEIASSAWGGGAMSVADILDHHTTVTAQGLEITLAAGNVIEVRGLFDAQLLADDVFLI